MSTQVSKYSTLSIPPSLRAVGLVTGSIGVLEKANMSWMLAEAFV
jgi:hypothetical protein